MSNNRFTIQELVLPIASKRQVTHYPGVTKNEKRTWLTTSTINQTNKMLLWAISILISSNLVRLLPPCDFYLYPNLFNSRSLMPRFWCTCLIPRRICTQVPYSSFLFLSWGSVPAYSIPEGYVHKYGDDLEWKAHSRGFPTRMGVYLIIPTHEGAFLGSFRFTRKSLTM